MATEGELAAARLVEKLERLEAEFENFIDAVKTEYHQWWDTMSDHEMDDFVKLLGLPDRESLRQFLITRGEARREMIFPRWMLED